jgi:predicted nicotinamide N-methyase
MDSNCWETIFREDLDAGLGNRLGVSYIRAQQEHVELNINGDKLFVLNQSSIGLMAISGVVWDAGLLLVDFIAEKRQQMRNVLDLGCGTGVCGIGALLLGAHFVVLSDKIEPPSLEENLSSLAEGLRDRIKFIAQSWESETYDEHLLRSITMIPEAASDDTQHTKNNGVAIDVNTKASVISEELSEPMHWDIVLCSDLLYEEKAHAALLRLLRQISFKEAIFSYKRRHDVPEQLFFRELSTFCKLAVELPSSIELKNLSKSSTTGLYIVIAEPLIPKTSTPL